MSEEKKWSVYSHINKINGKKYFGITSKNPPSNRWGKNGINYKSSAYFYSAIKKYGWDNFEHHVLYTQLTQVDASKKEIELINKYNSNNTDYGYNIANGGYKKNAVINGTNSKKVAQFTLNGELIAIYESISEALRQTKLLAYGSSISEVCHLRWQTAGGYQWRFIDDIDTVVPIDDYKVRVSQKSSKKVLQYSLDGNFVCEWDSAKKAYLCTNISSSAITGCCRGRYESAGGYQWRYFEDNYQNKINAIKPLNIRQTEKNKKKIIQKDLNGNIINQYQSLIEAVDKTGFYRSYIIDACKGRMPVYKDFIWEYA